MSDVTVVDGIDYCTAWPDVIWGMDLRYCCAQHDAFYEQQAALDLFAYLGAHWDLATCVASVSWGMAVVMFSGLVTVGAGYVVARHNKYQPGSSGKDR